MVISADLLARIERLEAHDAITQLIARYAVGADQNNNPDVLGPLFTDDAVWEAPGMIEPLVGRVTIAKTLAELGQSFVLWSLHYMVAPVIDLAEDRQSATVRWYLWELSTMTDTPGQATADAKDSWFGGWYDATAVLTADGWRLKYVSLIAKIQSPVSPPWTGKR
jgi:hypothetical protein